MKLTKKHINELGGRKYIVNEILKDCILLDDAPSKFKRSRRTIERWIKKGKLPVIHIQNHDYIDPLDIPKYVRKQK